MKTMIAAGLSLFVAVGCGGSAEPSQPNAATTDENNTKANPLPEWRRCVERGRFEPVGATVLDTTDRKQWQREVSPWQRTQIESAAYCSALELEGRSGWRVPSVAELTNIRLLPGGIKGAAEACVPSIDQGAFPETPPAEFWTSSMRTGSDGIYTDFADGRSHESGTNTLFYVRCVHDADVNEVTAAPSP